MKALWVILIDTSASMGEPFSGTSDFRGLTETGSYRTKLDAAKDTVLKQLNGLASGYVALVGFADEPFLVFKEHVDDAKRFGGSIQALTADGGTNIATALLFALTELGDLNIYQVISFLIISDGLSNRGDPIAAAEKCVDSQVGIRISTILIDPTPEGEKIARGISIGGDVKAVTSDIRLETAVAEGMAVHEQAIAAQQTGILWIIVAIGVFAGLSVTISGIYTGIAERPNIAIPILFASVSTISAGVLIYFIFAKEKIGRGLYLSPDAQEMYFPKTFKYSKRLRVFASVAGFVCVVVAVALIFFASSSARNKNKEIAERAVDQFHKQLNAGQYLEIYRQADYAFKESMSESHAIALFEALHGKLGAVKKSNQTGWTVNYSPNGALLSLTYNTEFTGGGSTEQFVWIVSGNKATLYQYNIDPPLLITK